MVKSSVLAPPSEFLISNKFPGHVNSVPENNSENYWPI